VSEQPRAYSPEEVRKLLRIGRSTYYKLCGTGLLKWSRVYPGGPRIHTQAQLDQYFSYLNGAGQSAIKVWTRRRAA